MLCTFSALSCWIHLRHSYWILSYKCRHLSANNTETCVYLMQLSKQSHPLSATSLSLLCRTIENESVASQTLLFEAESANRAHPLMWFCCNKATGLDTMQCACTSTCWNHDRAASKLKEKRELNFWIMLEKHLRLFSGALNKEQNASDGRPNNHHIVTDAQYWMDQRQRAFGRNGWKIWHERHRRAAWNMQQMNDFI